jgi:hypothetical protein
MVKEYFKYIANDAPPDLPANAGWPKWGGTIRLLIFPTF